MAAQSLVRNPGIVLKIVLGWVIVGFLVLFILNATGLMPWVDWAMNIIRSNDVPRFPAPPGG